MKIDQLPNLRRWATLEKHVIKTKGLADKITAKGTPVSGALLFRVLTEKLEQQREPAAALLPKILDAAKFYRYDPETDYIKHPEKAGY